MSRCPQVKVALLENARCGYCPRKGRRESETSNVECVQGVGVWEAQLGKGKDSCECEPVFRTDAGGTGIRRRMVGRCATLAVTNETDQAEHVEPE